MIEQSKYTYKSSKADFKPFSLKGRARLFTQKKLLKYSSFAFIRPRVCPSLALSPL